LGSALRVTKASMLIAAFMLLASTIPCAGQSEDPIGGEWVYSFNDDYYGMVFSGTWTLSCERIVKSPLGDPQMDVVEYHSLLVATGSDSTAMASYEGTMTMSEEMYYDAETSDAVGYISNQHMDMRFVTGNATSEYRFDERNETVYTPPGGSGTEPTAMNAGDSWTETYTKVSNSSGYEDGGYYSEESTWTETLEFTYLGLETVSVPAGVFQCDKIEIVASDGVVETYWYSVEVSSQVKIEDEYESGEIMTYELASYSLERNPSGGTVEMGSDLFMVAFCSFIVATVVAVVCASNIVKERRPPTRELEDIPPPPTD